jgi:hypothetical protein
MTRHVLDGPQFPESWPQGVPAGITQVLKRALSTDPQQRYADVLAFYAACKELEKKPAPVVKQAEEPKTVAPLPVETPTNKPGQVPAKLPTTTPGLLPWRAVIWIALGWAVSMLIMLVVRSVLW